MCGHTVGLPVPGFSTHIQSRDSHPHPQLHLLGHHEDARQESMSSNGDRRSTYWLKCSNSVRLPNSGDSIGTERRMADNNAGSKDSAALVNVVTG